MQHVRIVILKVELIRYLNLLFFLFLRKILRRDDFLLLFFEFSFFGMHNLVNGFLCNNREYLDIPIIGLKDSGGNVDILKTHDITKSKGFLQLLRRKVIKIHFECEVSFVKVEVYFV